MNPEKKNYESIKWKHVIGLAAPHTWPASILPSILGAALSYVIGGSWDPLLFVCLLVISVLMQSAVNTLNDYCDYLKENDTLDNSDDPSDAILVYYNINPKSARLLGFGFLMIAALIGVWVTIRAGYIPLAIGVFGGVIILLYSFGKLPISYMPLGEFVSGFVMGTLITLAVYTAIAGVFDPFVMVYTIPLVIGIALLMYTNNICDIEKDIPGGKKTITILLGRRRARGLYVVLLSLWVLSVICLVLIFFKNGAVLLLPLVIIALFLIARQMKLSLNQQSRRKSMTGILHIKLILQLGYIAIILVHGLSS